MRGLWWLAPFGVLMGAGLLVGGQPADGKTLYRQAAEALLARDVSAASLTLGKIVEECPTYEFAPLAALRLAECQLSQGQHQQSIETLERWIPRLEISAASRILEPAAPLRAQVVLARAYLMADRWGEVRKISTQQARAFPTPNQTEQKLLTTLDQTAEQATSRQRQSQAAILRQAAEAVREKRFSDALELLAKVDDGFLSTDWSWRRRVLQAQAWHGTGRSQVALDELDRIDMQLLKNNERQSVHLVMLDAAIAAGRFTRAQTEIEALEALDSQSGELGPTIALRAVELAMLQKDRDKADRLARLAKQQYPSFESKHEFDLLLARNALASVEFNTARDLLTAIIESPPASDPTALARAQWLMGESYLLSRDTPRAIAAYSAVIQDGRAPVWIESSLMQRGKCYEMVGELSLAARDYRSLVDDYPRSVLRSTASTRLQDISAIANSADSSAASVVPVRR